MASIHYSREKQAPHGIQSMKVKGVVSFHPSSIHAHDSSNPRFANFIVLEHGNDEIASLRLSTLRLQNENPRLQNIFLGIQTYLDKNNQLYACYKNMVEIEKCYLEEMGMEETSVTNDQLKFRIVDPKDLDRRDLLSHPGVYG
ncbi:hypothetical protein PAEPH01_2525, partial [Pancytospora epiphaga]